MQAELATERSAAAERAIVSERASAERASTAERTSAVERAPVVERAASYPPPRVTEALDQESDELDIPAFLRRSSS